MAGEYWLESANCDIEPAQLTLIRGGEDHITKSRYIAKK